MKPYILPTIIISLFLLPSAVHAHGVVGDRFFPPTIATDDPFATDEFSLPDISIFRTPAADGSPETLEIDTGFEFSKEIFPHLALSLSDQYIHLNPNGQHALGGWDDISLNLKYEFWRNAPHELILAFGLDADLGGTGDPRVAPDSFSTYTPTFYFGKGLGDLPDSLLYLKPLAVTGTLGLSLPTRPAEPNSLVTGLAIEYSLPYLQQTVKDVGIVPPFKNMIPLVEFSFDTPTNHPGRWRTTGTVNPGILWEMPTYQLGIEAVIPINHQTGRHVGALFQLQIYLDDLFPKIFGHPLFGAPQ